MIGKLCKLNKTVIVYHYTAILVNNMDLKKYILIYIQLVSIYFYIRHIQMYVLYLLHKTHFIIIISCTTIIR